jgi:hypothetical protein
VRNMIHVAYIYTMDCITPRPVPKKLVGTAPYVIEHDGNIYACMQVRIAAPHLHVQAA